MNIKYRHSASKTNTFIDSPAFWVINELFDFESDPNARMVMGLAAEDAANHALENQITDEDTITDYSTKKYLEHGLETTDECAWSGIIANKFVQNLREFGDVVSFQNELQVPGKKYGLKYDIVGKTDFEFKDVIIDTKATAYIRRLKAGHVDPKWYPKDQYCVDMTERDELKVLLDAMKHIEAILDICKTKEDVVRITPLVCDNFRWKGTPTSVDFAKEIWTKVMK